MFRPPREVVQKERNIWLGHILVVFPILNRIIAGGGLRNIEIVILYVRHNMSDIIYSSVSGTHQYKEENIISKLSY